MSDDSLTTNAVDHAIHSAMEKFLVDRGWQFFDIGRRPVDGVSEVVADKPSDDWRHVFRNGQTKL